MSRKNDKQLVEAISNLADLIPHGHLLVNVDPVGFIDTVTSELRKCREDKTTENKKKTSQRIS